MARIAAGWLDGAPDPPPGDLVIALVAALRESGQIDAALARTALVTATANGLDREETRILLVHRGALWLDRYEAGPDPDPDALARAAQCARRSWAIAPSDACSALYNRLRRLGA